MNSYFEILSWKTKADLKGLKRKIVNKNDIIYLLSLWPVQFDTIYIYIYNDCYI